MDGLADVVGAVWQPNCNRKCHAQWPARIHSAPTGDPSLSLLMRHEHNPPFQVTHCTYLAMTPGAQSHGPSLCVFVSNHHSIFAHTFAVHLVEHGACVRSFRNRFNLVVNSSLCFYFTEMSAFFVFK